MISDWWSDWQVYGSGWGDWINCLRRQLVSLKTEILSCCNSSYLSMHLRNLALLVGFRNPDTTEVPFHLCFHLMTLDFTLPVLRLWDSVLQSSSLVSELGQTRHCGLSSQTAAECWRWHCLRRCLHWNCTQWNRTCMPTKDVVQCLEVSPLLSSSSTFLVAFVIQYLSVSVKTTFNSYYCKMFNNNLLLAVCKKNSISIN